MSSVLDIKAAKICHKNTAGDSHKGFLLFVLFAWSPSSYCLLNLRTYMCVLAITAQTPVLHIHLGGYVATLIRELVTKC